MNESVLKLLTLSTIALVVFSAIWLASSVQATHKMSPAYRLVQTSKPSTGTHHGLQVVALPAERAASAALSRMVGVR